MNFEQKLDVVIKELMVVYNLNNAQANLIRRNIISRVKMYQNMNPSFNNDETKIVSNNSNIGDFFINRLVTNIRDYDFDQTYNMENTDKGTYTADKQSIYIGNYKFIEDITREKLQRRMTNLDDETLRKATINVLNHEIGHALQTSFKGKYGYNDAKYNQLIQNLCTKYPNEFKLQATDELLSADQRGMIPKSRKDAKEQIRRYYSRMSFTTHLDEVFNEDEALKVTGMNQPQLRYDMSNGFFKNIYNYQSSNYKITSYARMMKIVMGESRTFQSMYEDSIVAYEFFDQFKNLSDKVFQESTYEGKPPMLNILNALDQIRNQSSLAESQKLDLFLTECLHKKVIHELRNPDLNQNDINVIRNYINEFTNQMVRNPNVVTQQDTIISNINSLVDKREKQLNGNNLNQNSENNNNQQEVMNKINHLKNKVMQVHKDYKQMMADGQIDSNELNELISRMTNLMQVVNNMQYANLTENEKRLLNQINSIILSGQQQMNIVRSQYGMQDDQEITKSGYGR